MHAKTKRVYCDTSVIGGVLDREFAGHSRRFLDLVLGGRFRLVLSPVVDAEIRAEETPDEVVAEYERLLPLSETVEVAAEALRLQRAYIDAGILGPKWQGDALHVALASVSGCELIVSWNFRHIVNYQKIPLYNAVNALQGYGPISIFSPLELVESDEE
jgi:predicted nucleic acid-binding protein